MSEIALISQGRLLGTMSPAEARLCASLIRGPYPALARLADILDQAADSADEPHRFDPEGPAYGQSVHDAAEPLADRLVTAFEDLAEAVARDGAPGADLVDSIARHDASQALRAVLAEHYAPTPASPTETEHE